MVSGISDRGATLTHLDRETRALILLAAAVAVGEESLVEAQCRECVGVGVSAGWVDELLLQSLLMVGWPRTLNATRTWRRVGAPAAVSSEDGTDYSRVGEWRSRGEEVCRTVYGASYERLRQNVRNLHPALDAWMVVEGYGRTLGRTGLDLARRELCVAAQVAVQGAMRQLHSHLKGALHAGAGAAVIAEALDAIRPMLGAEETDLVVSLWKRIGE